MTRNVAIYCVALLTIAVTIGTSRADDRNDKSNNIDRLLVQAQKICPVMGKDLTKMGGPVKATIEKETVFLCCKSCFKGKVKREHWKQIQANLIDAQGKCPVMDKPLPKTPKSVVVKGRRIYVCCPPCTKKIEAAPDKYLAIVDGYLEANHRK
ncbi:MAG: hypothetical protein HUJ26_17940 [Planctomycetaceae bacterium]|nr:hypothetical protein [Planctomycetaceae bacterium]